MKARVICTLILALTLLLVTPVILTAQEQATPDPGAVPAETPAPAAPGTVQRPTGPVSILLVEPEKVKIGFWYRSTEVMAHASMPPHCDAALIIIGPEHEREMNVKGRKLGLWMTVGKAHFSKTPAFYKVLTTKPIKEMAPAEVADQNLLGYPALEKQIEVTSEVGDSQTHKDEYVGLMEGRNLFKDDEGGLRVTLSNSVSMEVEGKVIFPDLAPRGEYRVILLTFKDGKLLDRTEQKLTVELVGGTAFIHNLAFKHGWWYGIIAVVFALAAGLGVGFIFPSGGGH